MNLPSYPRLAKKLIASFVLMLSAAVAMATVVVPPTVSDLRGEWIGQTQNGEFARLTLTDQGAGILAINYFPNQPIWLYRVRVSKPIKRPLGSDLAITATPIGHKHAVTITDAKAFHGLINFKLKGDPFNGTYGLTPEAEAMTRLNKMTKNAVMRSCATNGC